MKDNVEIEIQKEAQEVIDWNKNKKRLKEYYLEIDEVLAGRQHERRSELVALFQNQEFQAVFYKDAVIAQLSVILAIYQAEQEDGIEVTILDQGESIKQIVDYFLMLKFKIWRVEMKYTKETADQLFRFVEERQTTLPAIKYMIHTSCFDKLNTTFKIARIFREANKPARAFAMFRYALELSPGEELVICEMADICMMNQQYDAAADLIEMLREKTDVFRQYQKRWE